MNFNILFFLVYCVQVHCAAKMDKITEKSVTIDEIPFTFYMCDSSIVKDEIAWYELNSISVKEDL